MAKKKPVKKNNAKKVVPKTKASISDAINTEIIAALSSINKPVLLKVCRLCETKDGPFLNIFDADKITAKKIEMVMPFGIAENDDLPHKICFRCSAKVEELYEFIQKCIKTQQNLRKIVGSKTSNNKSKHREVWEEKLNKTNMSNDDICNALIKKAMEGIKDIPANVVDEAETPPSKQIKKTQLKNIERHQSSDESNDDEPDIPLNALKELEKPMPEKSLRSKIEVKTDNKPIEDVIAKPQKVAEKVPKNPISKTEEKASPPKSIIPPVENKNITNKPTLQTNTFSLNETTKPPEPIFNIMDHVSMIKVNGVGILFQCKMCNRNFLKKEVVMAHACAKSGALKLAAAQSVTAPNPKTATVKYINTKTSPEVKKSILETITLDDDDDRPLVPKKPRPKIGPASKIRKVNETEAQNQTTQSPVTGIQPNTSNPESLIGLLSLPSLNSRYKLVPGPNNTFSLVEEKSTDNSTTNKTGNIQCFSTGPIKDLKHTSVGARKGLKYGETPANSSGTASNQPYPVGLFKTCNNEIQPEPAFTTPAMKKQSYTVVQTGNPSRLLISSKPKNSVQELPKKKPKRTRIEPTNKEPFSVTLEDTARSRDPGFFTFINVDPLLQPSYVLPTDNIIQESQISTSSSVVKNKKDDSYTCNMCNESFTREKKLLAHIQSHYSKMDEEDRLREVRNTRKRKK